MAGTAIEDGGRVPAAFGAVLAVGVGSSALAQTYPNRPIRMIAPFGPPSKSVSWPQ